MIESYSLAKKEFPKMEKRKKKSSSSFPGQLNKMRIDWIKENDI